MSIELSGALHTEVNHLNSGHSKRTFDVEGGRRFLKRERKRTGEGGSSLSARSDPEKKLPDFSNSKQSSFR